MNDIDHEIGIEKQTNIFSFDPLTKVRQFPSELINVRSINGEGKKIESLCIVHKLYNLNKIFWELVYKFMQWLRLKTYSKNDKNYVLKQNMHLSEICIFSGYSMWRRYFLLLTKIRCVLKRSALYLCLSNQVTVYTA